VKFAYIYNSKKTYSYMTNMCRRFDLVSRGIWIIVR
jgi:hypothetical protein